MANHIHLTDTNVQLIKISKKKLHIDSKSGYIH